MKFSILEKPKLGKPENVFIKIGMELFFNEGPKIVKELSEQGYQIFLDLKMNDIPNTVYNGAKALALTLKKIKKRVQSILEK